ncbi:phosphatase PAP2 family protein [Kitasatospora hibisci]|uniref:phosphatase PAP2 family protein n=1 Tax=Kitasatospora hibisci TaxID=3369522 RepID=UPI00375457BE
MPPSRAVRGSTAGSPPGLRRGRAPAVLASCWVVALAATATATWTTLGDAADDRPALPLPVGTWPSTATRVGLLIAALAAVTGLGALIGRNPPPGVRAPAGLWPLAAAAFLISAELRGHPADAVLGVTTAVLVLLDLLPRGLPPRRTPPHRGSPPDGPGCRPPAPPHAFPRGVALGVAIALHPALVLFAAALPPPPAGRRTTRTARSAPALTAVAVAVLLLAVAQLADPAAGGAFRHRLADHGVIADPGNETALGVLTRLGLHGPPLIALWTAVAAAAAALALRRGHALARDRQHLLAAGVVGCATLIVAPVAGPADLCWLLLAATGRLGRRPEDRALWPVVAVTVALLPSTLLDPGIEPVSGLLLRKAPTLLALAAATALPFRRRDDPLWHLARTPAPPPRRRPLLRGVPLLPARLRTVSRPNLVLELVLIQVGYGVYSYIRNAAPDRLATATDHARSLYGLEQTLRLDIEPAMNGWYLRSGDDLMRAAQQYYTTMHFTMVLLVLVWLYTRHPTHYRTGRTVLFAATGLALLGFWGYPLAPPRLVPELGLREYPAGAPEDAPLGALTALTNQYAAMPSLHIGWACWCALAVATTTRRHWLRAAAPLYPVVTFVVVVATANHWVLDAVGGVAVLLAGCVVQYVLTGRLLLDQEAALPAPRPVPTAASVDGFAARDRPDRPDRPDLPGRPDRAGRPGRSGPPDRPDHGDG